VAARAAAEDAEVRMGKQKPGVLSGMTTVDYVARIMELTRAVEWRDQKLAEQEATIVRLRELLDEARAKLSGQEISGDSPRRPTPPR
jgi:hypothetical protein